MKLGLIIAIIAGLFALYKLSMAKKVVNRRILIKAFRKVSALKHFDLPLEVRIDEIVKYSKEDVWLKGQLPKEFTVGQNKFDFVLVKPKSVDDNITAKKTVVCYVKAGHSSMPSELMFIDWGLIKIMY